MNKMTTLPNFSVGKEGNGLLLSHLQQLRQWQQQQQDNLRNVQQTQLEQIQIEQQKIKDILRNPLTSLNTISKSKSEIQQTQDTPPPNETDATEDCLKTLENFVSEPMKNEQEMNSVSASNKKGPFRFLKRGEGLVRFQGKSRPNENIASRNDKNRSKAFINTQPVPTKLIRKLSLKNTSNKENKTLFESKKKTSKVSTDMQIDVVDGKEELVTVVDTSSSSSKLHKEKEADELVEFEILEQVTRNCSFNSDSSIMRNLVNKPNNLAEPMSQNEKVIDMDPVNSVVENVISSPESLQNDSPNIYDFSDGHSSSNENTLCIADISTDSDVGELLELKEYCSDVIKNIDNELPDEVEKWKDLSSMDWSVDTPISSSFVSENEDLAKVPVPEEKKIEGNERTVLQERLQELEREILAFRKENKYLEELKKQQRELIKTAEKEQGEFNRKLQVAKDKFEQYMSEEKKKLKKQQMVFENYQKANKILPNKEERKEIAELKAEVLHLEDGLKKQKTQLSAEAGRLRSQIIVVEKERDHLKAEINRLGQEHLELLSIIKELKARPPVQKIIQPRKPVVSRFRHTKAIAQKHSGHQKQVIDKFKQVTPSIAKSVVQNKPVIDELKPRKPLGQKTVENENQGNVLIKGGNKALKKNDIHSTEKENSNDSQLEFNLQRWKTKSVRFNLETKDLDDGDKKKDLEKVDFEKDFLYDNLSEKEIDLLDENEEACQIIKHFDKIEKLYKDGERELIYNSGTKKFIDKDGCSATIYFYNGDVLMTLPDKTEIYHFMDSGVKQTRFSDGTTLLEFPHGQEERHMKDGSKEILLQDGTLHIYNSDGSQEVKANDGSVMKVTSDGSKFLVFQNGEKEIQTKDFKRREYLDGTVKIVHSDGKQETRYANGRLRIKDKDNNIIVDTEYS